MIKYIKISLITFVLFLTQQPLHLLSQQRKDSPLQPEAIDKIKYGLYGGLNIPVAPEEITRIPKIYDKSSESLMNGLDGLGYKSTIIIGVNAKFNFFSEFWAGANFSYSSWLSKNSCQTTNIPTVNSENFLSLFTFGINAEYYLIKNLYAGAGIDINVFSVNVKENNSRREEIDFSDKYSRLGICVFLGAEIPLIKKMYLDVSLKTKLTNLLGRQNDNKETIRSEALINSYGSSMESHIILFQLNFGIMFSTN